MLDNKYFHKRCVCEPYVTVIFVTSYDDQQKKRKLSSASLSYYQQFRLTTTAPNIYITGNQVFTVTCKQKSLGQTYFCPSAMLTLALSSQTGYDGKWLVYFDQNGGSCNLARNVFSSAGCVFGGVIVLSSFSFLHK